MGCDLLRCAFRHDSTTGLPAFRAEIDHMVGHLDNIQIVLNNHNRISGITESVQDLNQPMNIGKMQAGRWFVEEVHRMAC